MTASSVESNPQDQQNPHAQPLWFERLKTALCAIPFVFMQYDAVNYVNFSADPPARGERTELVLQFVAPKAR
jgi:hypothetical protein